MRHSQKKKKKTLLLYLENKTYVLAVPNCLVHVIEVTADTDTPQRFSIKPGELTPYDAYKSLTIPGVYGCIIAVKDEQQNSKNHEVQAEPISKLFDVA